MTVDLIFHHKHKMNTLSNFTIKATKVLRYAFTDCFLKLSGETYNQSGTLMKT